MCNEAYERNWYLSFYEQVFVIDNVICWIHVGHSERLEKNAEKG